MYDSMNNLYLTLAILKYADLTVCDITHNSLKTGREPF